MLVPPTPADAPSLLIVDDEHPLRLAVFRWFTRRGWRCTEAATLADAERLIFSDGAMTPDAILCDLNLPDGTGEDLLHRITRDRPLLAPRMILSTGEVLTDEMTDRLELLGCQTLPKPFVLADAESAARTARERRTSAKTASPLPA